MNTAPSRFATRLARAGLCLPGRGLVAELDDVLGFSRDDPVTPVLAEVVASLGVGSLILAPPAEPYAGILEFLAAREAPAIRPRDCETRTFFHDIPVVAIPTAQAMAEALSRRKGAYVPGLGIIAHGALSPEQAFVTVSSVAFAAFVKFFSDRLAAVREGTADPEAEAVLARAVASLPPPPPEVPPILARGPFATMDQALAALAEAGRATVELGLVDSVFGNISYNLDGILAISQTGAALDALEGCVDACPLDGSSCAGLTASSELAAHAALARLDGRRAILHGHPKFAVIMSMDCAQADCPERGACHLACPGRRFLGEAPIVPGEVGAGPRGLVHTMPPALVGRPGVVVLGHGVFTAGREDFGQALAALCAIEGQARRACLAALGQDGGGLGHG
jgi:ribulose-5-phosphate 4-epimerase/fuculose-1-phosphate aldolase